jgi:hypothetical protein
MITYLCNHIFYAPRIALLISSKGRHGHAYSSMLYHQTIAQSAVSAHPQRPFTNLSFRRVKADGLADASVECETMVLHVPTMR